MEQRRGAAGGRGGAGVVVQEEEEEEEKRQEGERTRREDASQNHEVSKTLLQDRASSGRRRYCWYTSIGTRGREPHPMWQLLTLVPYALQLQVPTFGAIAGAPPAAGKTKAAAAKVALVDTELALAVETSITKILWGTRCLAERRMPMRLGVDVEIRTNDKGKGLYALRDLAEGELVGAYWGKLLTADKYQNCDSDGAYAMGLANGKVVDGADERRSSFLRYINHSFLKANCMAIEEVDFPIDSIAAVSMQVDKDIAAGQELLFDYGVEYWDARVPRWNPKRLVIDCF